MSKLMTISCNNDNADLVLPAKVICYGSQGDVALPYPDALTDHSVGYGGATEFNDFVRDFSVNDYMCLKFGDVTRHSHMADRIADSVDILVTPKCVKELRQESLELARTFDMIDPRLKSKLAAKTVLYARCFEYLERGGDEPTIEEALRYSKAIKKDIAILVRNSTTWVPIDEASERERERKVNKLASDLRSWI